MKAEQISRCHHKLRNRKQKSIPPKMLLYRRAAMKKVVIFQPLILKTVFSSEESLKVKEMKIVLDLVVKKLSQVMKILEMKQSLSQ